MFVAGGSALPTPAATPQLAAGGGHAIAVHASGTLRAWGNDDAGQLGTGRELATSASVALGLTGVVSMAGGDFHTVVAKSDGTVWGAGANTSGQLGDGSTTNRASFVQAKGISDVVAVAAGGHHTLALRRDGSVWGWGANSGGQAGDLSGEARLRPAPIAGLAGIVAVAAGEFHSLALKSDGTVWSWGWNCYGQVRPGASPAGDSCTQIDLRFAFAPQQVPGLTDVVAIDAGPNSYQSIALRRDGTVAGWGNNVDGQLGIGSSGTTHTPVTTMVGITGAVAIAAGGFHTLVLKADGTVWAAGYNGQGQLGDGRQISRTVAVQVSGATGVRALAAGFRSSHALRSDGSVLAWGDNRNGQLGDGTTVNRLSPVVATALAGISAIASGGYHVLALRGGALIGVGLNGSGQLAQSGLQMRTTPVAVAALDRVVAVAAGTTHTLVLREDGTVYGFGRQAGGELGDGTFTSRTTPVQAIGVTDAIAIAAGYQHSLALRRDGTILSWGSNFFCAVGCADGSGPRTTPARYPALTNVRAIAAGYYYSMALLGDGTVWTWGVNDRGQRGLNLGASFQPLEPERVPGLADVVAIAAGLRHALALTRDGAVWAWGANDAGQVGDGTTVDKLGPVRVIEPGRARSISAGYTHSVAQLVDGTVAEWGDLYPRERAVTRPRVLPSVAAVSQVVAGNGFTLAAVDDGTVASWGDNTLGRLGDGSFAARPQAVAVLREGGAGTLEANDWFLDLRPGAAKSIPAERVPAFQSTALRNEDVVDASVRARAGDRGKPGSYYVFALAPATRTLNAQAGDWIGLKAKAGAGARDTPVACVLAQLDASGQLHGVSASNLQAYLTGVIGSGEQAVRIVDGVPDVNIAGATFFVGYGSSPDAMLAAGTNRSVATMPAEVECRPEAPQTGWWWNPAEDGRGFSIERRGASLFFAAFLYDVSGRSTWYVSSGAVSLEGALYSGDLLSAAGGQTLGGAYPGFPTLTRVGAVSLAFNTSATGTMVWPGGVVPIRRFDIVPNGLTLAAPAGIPESGWWWNEQEAGRGFFMEWQGNTLDIAGYMYDEQGNSVWSLTVGEMAAGGRSFRGTWWRYGNGQTLTGAWKPNARIDANVAPLGITFSGPDTALMTLPNGRTTSLRRHRF